MWSLPFLAIGGAIFFWMISGRFVETDNAYVKGDRAYIATEISGPIVEVPVHDRGPCARESARLARPASLQDRRHTPYRTALAKIEADIEIQRAEIRGLRAQWRTKREDIKAAQSQYNYAMADYERQKDLAERKFAPVAKLDESRMGLEVARQRIASLEEDLTRIEAQLAGDPKIKVDDHPRVKQMMAGRDEALLNQRRTHHRAPMDGIVQKVLVPGSYAVMGVPSVAVIANSDLWIEANFKETEAHARARRPAGQDLGRHLPGHGVPRQGDIVRPDDGCGVRRAAGRRTPLATGSRSYSAFLSHVVECREGDPPLRVGMSVTIEIDTGHRRTFGDLLKMIGL